MKKGCLRTLLIIAAVVFVAFIVTLTRASKKASEPIGPIVDITVEDIHDELANKTDAQIDAYLESLQGVRVSWSGTVNDVTTFGGFTSVIVTMKVPGLLRSAECSVSIPKDQALNYNKGQAVSWTGAISRASLIGSQLDVSFVSAQID